MKSLLIFDLDGTLLDTVTDLAASTNYALTQCNFPTHELSAYKLFIGNGINNLFERALPKGEKTAENIWEMRKHFLEFYGEHSTELTVPFPGISELLQKLQSAGFKLAVASNKYQQGTETLIQRFFPEIQFTAVFGQREGIPVKPDPTIVHDILAIAMVQPSEVMYIGDSGVDMQTANNAGVDAIGVTWGFRPKAELEAFHPNYLVDKAEEILRIVSL
ncbi:MAG: HAD family hydrolase [Paludibacter sp.]|nr:HAD family hydrolase [Paludibacter sp.]